MGFYIRMYVEVIKDMGYFLFIFTTTIVAFGHAFLLLARNDSGDEVLIPDFFKAIMDSYVILDIRDDVFADYVTWYSW
eukprot:CAMPEP_0202978654 /NCGR_PEP_ID=MMETSP1396-20130829/85008_1 /ASSEMBLY_ACC=CAM_ASM_000872 /TAXON_ID= /ORGANISM="Pseudokeronopsis sp., Strain Brazil" /LENGTH=77 /DNA_ID=CAMNT_0049717703 /DNA_START=997 /DNA_END=1227 /DNA_ORIENTATION=+